MSVAPGDRIAIVMLTAIGDVVHTMPVINSLRAAVPDCHITWVIQPGPSGLVAGHAAIDELILFDRKAGWRAFAGLRRAVSDRRFDLVLGLQVYLKAGLITGMLSSPRKVGFDRARARDLNWLFTNDRIAPHPLQHMQDQYLEFVSHLGITPQYEWNLGATDAERARYLPQFPATEQPVVSIVVGTSKPEKEWPAERYAELIDRLHDELGVCTMLVGGRSPRELAAAATIERLAARAPVNALEWDLRKLATFLEASDVVVSPDTGPLHIAVAVDTPTVSLIGYTNPKWIGPYRRYQDLLVDAYGDPGEEYPVSTERRDGRMSRITVDAVFRKVALALERYPR